MKSLHLAIDTSCTQPVVAILSESNCLAEWQGEPGPHHGELVLVGVDYCLEQANADPKDLEFISVGIGPGTFTGLRIGVTTAKFLASTWNCGLVPVSSLYAQAITASSFLKTSESSHRVWSTIDAHRNEVYAATYSCKDLEKIDVSNINPSPEFAESPEKFTLRLRDGDILIGDGAETFKEQWPEYISIRNDSKVALLASAIGKIGFEFYKLNGAQAPESVQSKYFPTEKY